jgi:hypothetical protein
MPIDQWRPIYPIELREYAQYGASFQNTGYFSGVPVFDQNGARSQAYLPAAFEPYEKTNRNSYSASISVSQILTKRFNYPFYGCFATGRFVGNAISKSLFC